MPISAERVDELLTNFVVDNDGLLSNASVENPEIHEVVMGAITLLSNKFGKGQVLIPEPPAPLPTPPPPSPEPPIPSSEPTPQIVKNEFMVGDIFYNEDDKTKIFTIESIIEGDTHEAVVQVKNKNGILANFPISEVNRYFKEGTWVKAGRVPLMPQEPPPAPVMTDDGVTIEDLKNSIKALKPLAEFDEEVKTEIERLKAQIKELKKKKS